MVAQVEKFDTITTQASLGASGATAAFGALTAQEIAAWGGLGIALITLAVNVAFKVLHYRLEKRRKDAGA